MQPTFISSLASFLTCTMISLLRRSLAENSKSGLEYFSPVVVLIRSIAGSGQFVQDTAGTTGGGGHRSRVCSSPRGRGSMGESAH
ncbi:hypothetical protein DFH07DRAFT_819392 [Mycena maculata]|uniref:Secreted protein n=1 Tax=Mycena maculata TaxID=230809 RepID=A0AAD7J991_9AGAR|nr:hypothetical protein DFH07DRAFT_819392 [Mycena maculata]